MKMTYAKRRAQEATERLNSEKRREGKMPPPPHVMPKVKVRGGWRRADALRRMMAAWNPTGNKCG